MEFLKKHSDLLILLGVFAGAFQFLYGEMKEMRKNVATMSIEVDRRFATLEKDIAEIATEVKVMKAVMITNGAMRPELAIHPHSIRQEEAQ